MVNSLKSWRPGGRVHGRWGWIHTVWVTSLFQCTTAQLSITPDVVTAAVGDTVTLSVRYEGRLEYVAWFRGGGTRRDDVILSLFGSDPPVNGPQSTGRESLLPDGSLRITDVQTNHNGTYTVRMYAEPRGPQVAIAQLRVHGTPPPSDAPSTTWRVTLAVASGMLLGAVVAVLGVVLLYKRCTKKANGATPGGSPRAIYESAVNYENVKKGNQAQPAAQSPDADQTYMIELIYGKIMAAGNPQENPMSLYVPNLANPTLLNNFHIITVVEVET
ncbi:uncharacterized protein LOC144768902 [Lissotriton helveticus]